MSISCVTYRVIVALGPKQNYQLVLVNGMQSAVLTPHTLPYAYGGCHIKPYTYGNGHIQPYGYDHYGIDQSPGAAPPPTGNNLTHNLVADPLLVLTGSPTPCFAIPRYTGMGAYGICHMGIPVYPTKPMRPDPLYKRLKRGTAAE